MLRQATMADAVGMGSLGFLSIFLGVIAGVGGILGTILGGRIADKYGRVDYRYWMSIPGWASLLVIPIFILAMLAPSATIAIPRPTCSSGTQAKSAVMAPTI